MTPPRSLSPSESETRRGGGPPWGALGAADAPRAEMVARARDREGRRRRLLPADRDRRRPPPPRPALHDEAALQRAAQPVRLGQGRAAGAARVDPGFAAAGEVARR